MAEFTRQSPGNGSYDCQDTTPAVDASDRCNCRPALRRTEGRSGELVVKSLGIIVEMKSDFQSGNSSGIRTTGSNAEFLSRNGLLMSKSSLN